MKNKPPSAGLPFANTVGDSIELMKKMWGIAGLPNAGNIASMAIRLPQQLPSMVAPTFDVEELDRRIADLRAVEQWLELNAGMLRATIQTLEVQRSTIATLKGLSGAMLSPLGRPGSEPTVPTRQETTFAPVPPMPPARPSPEPAATPPRKTARKPGAPKPPPTLVDAPLNPTAWWNTLTDQFSKIAATAGATPPPPPAKKAAKRTRRRAARAKDE
jgi:hypothetical protein